jgi:glucuronoarabinoxylan endo-1,4-beta-xylanase
VRLGRSGAESSLRHAAGPMTHAWRHTSPYAFCVQRWGRYALRSTAIVLLSCIKASPPAGSGEPGGSANREGVAGVSLFSAERHQTLEGFGASVAFNIDLAVGGTPADLYRVLFPDLGLDILRFRNRYRRSEPNDGDLAQEVEILRRASEALGSRPKIMLSSWSPPAGLKANGQELCRGNEDCTLRRENGHFVYEKFADYWLDSLRYYASLGIVPDYVTLQNEPDFIPPDWEGCRFDPTETDRYPGYDRALEAVQERLSTLPSPPKVLGPEVVGVHGKKVEVYTRAMNLDLVYGIAHHLYEKGDDGIWDWRSPGPDSYVQPMKNAVAAAKGKPLFQTEFQTDEDRGVEGGFETAWLIHNSLVEEGVAAFLYWDLVWRPPGGLVSVDGSHVTTRDQYEALRHYARFTDPGYVRIGARSDVNALKVSAFSSPSGDRVTVVLLNTGQTEIDARIDPQDYTGVTSAIYRTTYRPGGSEVWSQLGSLPPSGLVRLPPKSEATVVLDGHS